MQSFVLRRLSLVLALVLVAGLAVAPVSAQCTPASGTTGNDNILCGNDFGTLDVMSGNDLITIGADDSIADIINGDGIVGSGNGVLTLIVFADGTDDDTYYSYGDAILVDGNGDIVARGRIFADDSGIRLVGNGSITFGQNNPPGAESVLLSSEIGLWIEGSGTIDNFGQVRGDGAGIVLGTLDSPEDLLQPLTTTGTVNNYGVVEGGLAGIAAIGNDLQLNNFGSASGMAAMLAYGSGAMSNHGEINGLAGMVFISQVSLDQTVIDDLMNNPPADEFELILGIADVVNSMEFVGEATINNNGLINAQVGALLIGNGSVNNLEDGDIENAMLGLGAYGNADINNHGGIHNTMIGAALIGQIEIDTGTLETVFEAVIDDCGCVTNPIMLLLAAVDSINFAGGGTINNTGVISNVMIGAIQLGNGSIVNSGIVFADALGAALYGNGEINNSNLIVAPNGVGVLFIGDIDINNTLYTDPESLLTALMAGEATIFDLVELGNGTIDNSGVVVGGMAGIAAIGDVTIDNSGVVVARDVGIVAAGGDVTVNNSGMVGTPLMDEFTPDLGILVAGNGTVNNSGEVYGHNVGIMAVGDVTVNVANGGSVYGGSAAIVGVAGNQTVNVDGLVEGGDNIVTLAMIPSVVDENRMAIALEDGDDRVSLFANADVQGNIYMGDDDDTVQIASGAHVTGTIDGGSQVIADTLIVGNELLCGEAEGTTDRVVAIRNLIANIDPTADTFVFDGQTYNIADFERVLNGAYAERCYQFVQDGRINAYDMAAPVAGYCNVEQGLNVWPIDADGNGSVAFSVSADQMRVALEQAVNGGENVLIQQGGGTSLWALASNQYQMMGVEPGGKNYVYIFEPGRCGEAGKIN